MSLFNKKIKKDILSEFRNYIFKIFAIFLFFTCLYYLGRTPQLPSSMMTKHIIHIR